KGTAAVAAGRAAVVALPAEAYRKNGRTSSYRWQIERPCPAAAGKTVLGGTGAMATTARFDNGTRFPNGARGGARTMGPVRRILALGLIAALLVSAAGPAYALPSAGEVKHGQATITSSGGTLTVDQATDKIIIHWQDFSIGDGE